MADLRKTARELKHQILVVYFATRAPRTPWLVRGLTLLVAAYALSPIDLIPDFIPILGYLDDLLIVPFGLFIVLRLLPEEVTYSAKRRAAALAGKPTSRAMAVAIVAIWLLVVGSLGVWAWRTVRA